MPGQELQLHDGTETSPEQFRKNPDSLCSTVTWEDEEDTTTWVYQARPQHLSIAMLLDAALDMRMLCKLGSEQSGQ